MSSSHLKWLETVYNQFVSGDKIILRVFLIFFFLLPAERVLALFVQFLSLLLCCLERLVILNFCDEFQKGGKGDKKLMDIYTYSFLYIYLYFIYIHETSYNKYIAIIKADYTIANLLLSVLNPTSLLWTFSSVKMFKTAISFLILPKTRY